MKELESKQKKFDPHLHIKTINIRIYLTNYNMYRAELKQKSGRAFVGYGGYPIEAMQSLLFCLEFRVPSTLINELLIHDEWE